jgi:hypothetical protein
VDGTGSGYVQWRVFGNSDVELSVLIQDSFYNSP